MIVHGRNEDILLILELVSSLVIAVDMESKICMECAIAKQGLGEDTSEFSTWYSRH